jgi:hypothetical protein
MRHLLRLSIGAAALAALAACSHSSDQPALSDDLKQDLARAGASDVQLAGAPAGRVDVVSAVERADGAVAAPKSPTVSRTASTTRGRRAPTRSARHETPAAAQPAPTAVESAPAVVRTEQPAIEDVPAAGRPQAPRPSTQREPPGGWRTPGQVIRNAPFPINP